MSTIDRLRATVYADWAHREMLPADLLDDPEEYGLKRGVFRLEAAHFSRAFRTEYGKGPDRWKLGTVLEGFTEAVHVHVPDIGVWNVVVNIEKIPLDPSHPQFADRPEYQDRDPYAWRVGAEAFFPESCRIIRIERPNVRRVGWWGLLPKFSIDEPEKAERAIASIDLMQWFWNHEHGPDFVAPNCYVMPAGFPVGVTVGPRLEALLKVYRRVSRRANRQRKKPIPLVPYVSSNYEGDSTLANRMTTDQFGEYVDQVIPYSHGRMVHFGGPGTRASDMNVDQFTEHLSNVVEPVLIGSGVAA